MLTQLRVLLEIADEKCASINEKKSQKRIRFLFGNGDVTKKFKLKIKSHSIVSDLLSGQLAKKLKRRLSNQNLTTFQCPDNRLIVCNSILIWMSKNYKLSATRSFVISKIAQAEKICQLFSLATRIRNNFNNNNSRKLSQFQSLNGKRIAN